MRVAVIGPTSIDRVASAAGVDPEVVTGAAEAVGSLLAVRGDTLVCVPDRGVAIVAARAYKARGGHELVGIVPSSGPSEWVDGESVADGSIAANVSMCDVLVHEYTWFEQHHTIGRLSDRMVAIGLSPGTLAELAWTKWTPGPSTALVDGTSSPPPPELLAETPVTVVSLAELDDWLSAPPIGGDGSGLPYRRAARHGAGAGSVPPPA